MVLEGGNSRIGYQHGLVWVEPFTGLTVTSVFILAWWKREQEFSAEFLVKGTNPVD